MAQVTNLELSTYDQDLIKMAATNNESYDEIEAQIFLLAKRLKRNKLTEELEEKLEASEDDGPNDSDEVSNEEENEFDDCIMIHFFQDLPGNHEDDFPHKFSFQIYKSKNTIDQLIEHINNVSSYDTFK